MNTDNNFVRGLFKGILIFVLMSLVVEFSRMHVTHSHLNSFEILQKNLGHIFIALVLAVVIRAKGWDD